MTALQKVFLMYALMYIVVKVVLGLIIYLITKKVEEKALVRKKYRERILRVRRAKNMDLYKKQYQKAEEKKKRDLSLISKAN